METSFFGVYAFPERVNPSTERPSAFFNKMLPHFSGNTGDTFVKKPLTSSAGPVLFGWTPRGSGAMIPGEMDEDFLRIRDAMAHPDSGEELNWGLIKPFMRNRAYQPHAEALFARHREALQEIPAAYRQYINDVWGRKICHEAIDHLRQGERIDLDRDQSRFATVFRTERPEHDAWLELSPQRGAHRPNVVIVSQSPFTFMGIRAAELGYDVTSLSMPGENFELAKKVWEHLPESIQANLDIRQADIFDPATYDAADKVAVSLWSEPELKGIYEAVRQSANAPEKTIYDIAGVGLGQLQSVNIPRSWLKDRFDNLKETPGVQVSGTRIPGQPEPSRIIVNRKFTPKAVS